LRTSLDHGRGRRRAGQRGLNGADLAKAGSKVRLGSVWEKRACHPGSKEVVARSRDTAVVFGRGPVRPVRPTA
jgi:hypothetical protein